VLYVITKLNSVDVRSLYSCTVCGHVIIVGCVCVPGVPVLVRSGHRFKMFLSVLSINVNWCF
jgi:hypothetical protein